MEKRINRDTLVEWLLSFDPEQVHIMEKTDHGKVEPMKYHMEGNVWTHTLMVMTYVETYFDLIDINLNKYITYKNYVKILTAALLHDFGKPKARKDKYSEERGEYYSFTGHEGISTFMSLKYLSQLKKDFPETYKEEVIKDILHLVSLHGTANQEENEEMSFLRSVFRKADKKGAIRSGSLNEEKVSDYQPRKFVKKQKKEENKELVLLTGLPNSGKSSLIENKYKDYVIISRDNTIETFYKIFNETEDIYTYNQAYKWIHSDEILKEKFNNFFEEEIKKVIKEKPNKIVVDMTLLTLKSRRKMLNHFSKYKAKSIVLLPNLEKISQRNEERKKEGKYISQEVYDSMYLSFVIPQKEEGFESVEIRLDLN